MSDRLADPTPKEEKDENQSCMLNEERALVLYREPPKASATTATSMTTTNSMTAATSAATTVPRLPVELILQIIEWACIDPEPCFTHLVDQDYDCHNWYCQSSHLRSRDLSPPPLDLDLLSAFWRYREYIYRAYYKYNTFVFHETGGEYSICPRIAQGENDVTWEELRDPRATRLLGFTDKPRWNDKGSRFVDYYHIDLHGDEYRHLITRIVTRVRGVGNNRRVWDCDWPLRMNYRLLPNLEYLLLDLYEFKLRCTQAWTWNVAIWHHSRLIRGARLMQVLKLKELVVFGLLDFLPGWRGPRLKEIVEDLFRPVMAPGGEIKIRDSYGVEW